MTDAPPTHDLSAIKRQQRRAERIADLAPVISLAALAGFFAVASDSFLRIGTLGQILTQGSAMAIAAAGLTFVLISAEIDLAVGTVALWTACFAGWLFREWFAGGAQGGAWGVAVVLLVPLASALVLGLIAGWLTVWSGMPSFIITLAMMNIAEGAARWLTQSETLNLPDVLKQVGNAGWRISAEFTLPYSAILALIVFALGHVVLVHTRFGRYVYMTGGNREAARLAGVRTGRTVVLCLAICAVTAGLAGLVNAGRLERVSLDQNRDLLLNAVACVVLGGTSLFGGEGSMLRTVLGVLTFTVLRVGLNQIDRIDDLARPLLMGLVLLVALVINGRLARKVGSRQ